MDCKQFCERTKRYKAEIIIFLLFILLWVVAWSGIKPKVLSKEQRIYAHYISHKERALAADAMKSAIIGTLTATSIILAYTKTEINFQMKQKKILKMRRAMGFFL